MLVCWWCVGGVLPGALPPLRVGALVVWCGGVNVCVCMKGVVAPCGLVVLVCWWCDAWGNTPLWFGGLGRCPVVDRKYS